MSGETSMEDLPLIDLFRSEVETHAEVLSAALLALEASPGDVSRLGEMMRAAHSIKGAARVVGVDPAVSVAHVMEDCFVAAQKESSHPVAGRHRRPAARCGPSWQDLGSHQGPPGRPGQRFRWPGESARRRAGGDARSWSQTRRERDRVADVTGRLAIRGAGIRNEIGRAVRRAPSATDLPFRDDHDSRNPGFCGRRGDPQAVSHGDRGWLRLGPVRHEGDQGPRRARAGTPGSGRSPRRRPRSSAASGWRACRPRWKRCSA